MKQIQYQIKICSLVKLFDYLCLHRLGATYTTTASVMTISRNNNHCLWLISVCNIQKPKKRHEIYLQFPPSTKANAGPSYWPRRKTHEFAMKTCSYAIAAKLLVCNANTFVLTYIFMLRIHMYILYLYV